MAEDDAPIEIVAYNAAWPQLFREEQMALQRTLGPWLKGPIEHIGSTAVPGLASKPVIDIMAAVGTLQESRPAIVALQSLGYLHAPYREDVMHWFCKPSSAFRTHHLHLVPFGSALWTARLAFRDRLRQDRDVASQYLELKLRLAREFPNDRERYTDGKTNFVAHMITESLNEHRPNQTPEPTVTAVTPHAAHGSRQP